MADEKSILEQFKGMKRQDLSDWERWGKKWFRRLLIGIPVSLFLIWLILLLLANHKLNNAKKRVAALGESLRYEDYAPPVVPAGENASIYLEKASQVILKNQSFFSPAPSGYGGGYPGMGRPPGMGPGPAIGPGFGGPVSLPGSTLPVFPNSAEDIKDLKPWRDALADSRDVELLRIIDEAAPLENARYDTDYTVEPSVEIGMRSHIGYIELIARLLIVRATLAMADENTEGAYKDMTLGYRLAYWVGQEHPGSSNAHMSSRLASRFWESTQRLFRSSPPNKQQRDALVAEAKRLMEAEFIIRGTMTQRIIASEMSDLWNSRSRAGGQPDARVWLINYPLRPWTVAYGAYMLDLHTCMIEMSKEPYYRKSLQEKQFEKDHPAPWYLGLPPIAPYPSLPRYHLRTQVFMLQIACLLEDYREEKGNYPDSLDILTDVPLDPYGGGPFHYQLKDGGYILYSISANLQDDGGTPPSATSTWDPEGDIVWTMQPK